MAILVCDVTVVMEPYKLRIGKKEEGILPPLTLTIDIFGAS